MDGVVCLSIIWELCLLQVAPFVSLQGLQMGIYVFGQKETGAERVAMETELRVSFCFFWDAHLWCKVSRTLLQYFQRYRLFSIFPMYERILMSLNIANLYRRISKLKLKIKVNLPQLLCIVVSVMEVYL